VAVLISTAALTDSALDCVDDNCKQLEVSCQVLVEVVRYQPEVGRVT